MDLIETAEVMDASLAFFDRSFWCLRAARSSVCSAV